MYMENSSGYYVLFLRIITERAFVMRDLSMRLEHLTKETWSENLDQIFANDKVKSKLALLLFQFFSSAEAYEKDPREWYHRMLLKSYTQITDEEIRL